VQANTDPPTQTDLHAWEEVVEVSFTAVSGQVLLTEWDGPGHEDLGSVVAAGSCSYRLRVLARGRDQAHAIPTAPEEPVEEHLLITWPDTSSPTRTGCVPPASVTEAICPAQGPRGGVVRPRRKVRFTIDPSATGRKALG
jgi:hypothetical protein